MKKLALIGLTAGLLLVGCSETEVTLEDSIKDAVTQEESNEKYPDQRTPEEMKENSWALETQGILTESDWEAIEGEQSLLEMTKLSAENSAKASLDYRHKIVTVNAILEGIATDGKDMFLLSTVTKEEQKASAWDDYAKQYNSTAYVNDANKDKIAAALAEKTIDEPIKFKALVIGISGGYVFEVIEIY